MKKLTELLDLSNKYIVDSKTADLIHFFPRDLIFSQKQRDVIKKMVEEINSCHGNSKRTREAIENAFKDLKKIFLDMIFNEGYDKSKKWGPFVAIIYTYDKFNEFSKDGLEKGMNEGTTGTAAVKMLHKFRTAVNTPGFQFDYPLCTVLKSGADPFIDKVFINNNNGRPS